MVKAGQKEKRTFSATSSRVTLEKTTLKNMVGSARLMPGMTLSAEIIVGQRSVMSYLAWPLTKGLSEAVREP